MAVLASLKVGENFKFYKVTQNYQITGSFKVGETLFITYRSRSTLRVGDYKSTRIFKRIIRV